MIAANSIIGGRYRVVKALGGGGMKLVYLAEDLRLAARPCALAEMVDSFTSPDAQKQAIAAFQREADMLAQLSNEHIPRVFDRFSEANRHYLVMEYIDGVTLEDELRVNGGKLTPERVVDIAIQILDTLEYLHQLSPPVIYRDLKPSNVMVTSDGHAKLIDFGIARHFQPLSNATMIGTQGYAPPEQYRGRVETRSDLYALGATMHHALSGRDPAAEPPFSFPPLRKLCPDIDPKLAAAVDQALAYDVVNRMHDATEFKRLLEGSTGSLASSATAGAPVIGAAMSSASKAGAQPQLRLPLGGARGGAPVSANGPSAHTPLSPGAPTILSVGNEIKCPSCTRSIPADSRFCSYCAADLHGTVSKGPRFPTRPDDETVMLSTPRSQPSSHSSHAATRRELRQMRRETRRRSGLRHPWLLLAVIFAGAFLIAKLILRAAPDNTTPRGYDTGSSEPSSVGPSHPPNGSRRARRGSAPEGAPVPGPDTSDSAEGEPGPDLLQSARLLALRKTLDAQGYSSVHFRMDRGTLVVWGTVPTAFDRAMVQFFCSTGSGVYSLEDQMTVAEDSGDG